jgi:hypothetical protein
MDIPLSTSSADILQGCSAPAGIEATTAGFSIRIDQDRCTTANHTVSIQGTTKDPDSRGESSVGRPEKAVLITGTTLIDREPLTNLHAASAKIPDGILTGKESSPLRRGRSGIPVAIRAADRSTNLHRVAVDPSMAVAAGDSLNHYRSIASPPKSACLYLRAQRNRWSNSLKPPLP